ncbi:MAG: hypothetical protein JWN46_3314 [Acidimicrobiales bacterium]|nr:hypothetical protein [Acidimicrobiales bacterium]
MITLRDGAAWEAGSADGVIRDIRQPVPDDGRLSGAVMLLGDPVSGPAISMSIEGRLFPRKAPVHMHKTDTFRMALNDPLVVGRSTYQHGGFRLQQADTFYGPELWTDEVGTNQVLIMADRRGVKPYLPDETKQGAIDLALEDSDDLLATSDHLPRDAVVDHEIANDLGAELHAGHWDAAFAGSATWPQLSDGSRLGIVAMGDRVHGPLLLFWDRPADAAELPGFAATTDLVRLVVEGSCTVAGVELGRLGFRLQQAGTRHGPSQPGPAGAQELWVVADRREAPSRFDAPASTESARLVDDVVTRLAPPYA